MLEKKGRSYATMLGMLEGRTDEQLGLLMDLMVRPMGSSSSACWDGAFAVRAGACGCFGKAATLELYPILRT
jgi:hypothetical protein